MIGELNRDGRAPARELTTLRDSLTGLFDDFFQGRAMGGRMSEVGYAWTPAVDVRETADELVVYAALPGVAKEDVQLEVKENTLVIGGDRKPSNPGEDGWLRQELPAGRFFRAFGLPADVRSQDVKAAFRNGVLEIHLPKAEEAKPHKVRID